MILTVEHDEACKCKYLTHFLRFQTNVSVRLGSALNNPREQIASQLISKQNSKAEENYKRKATVVLATTP